PYAADVARQGGDLGARTRPRRREACRVDPGGDAQLLRGRPRPPPRLGLRLRRLPGLRIAPPRMGGLRRERMSYAVKEIFYTLQGEGALTGRPAVFCRFSGCNLWSGREADRSEAVCKFCDTDFVGIDGTEGGRYRDAD